MLLAVVSSSVHVDRRGYDYFQAAVAQVMGRVQPFKVELALKYVKAKLTDFRSEERRKVSHTLL